MSKAAISEVRKVNRLFNDRLGKHVWQFKTMDEVGQASNHLHSDLQRELQTGWLHLKQLVDT